MARVHEPVHCVASKRCSPCRWTPIRRLANRCSTTTTVSHTFSRAPATVACRCCRRSGLGNGSSRRWTQRERFTAFHGGPGSSCPKGAVAHWWSLFLVPSPARLRGERGQERFILIERQFPRCGGPHSFQTHRNQQQRRETWFLAVLRLKPFEKAERDEQHVDVLLGQGRAGVQEHPVQPVSQRAILQVGQQVIGRQRSRLGAVVNGWSPNETLRDKRFFEGSPVAPRQEAGTHE